MSFPEFLSVEPVLEELKQQISQQLLMLDHTPRMALLRCVSDPGALNLEKEILSACRDTGVEPWVMNFPDYLPLETLVSAVHRVGQDPSIDGVALICPAQYDKSLLGSAIGEGKEINGFLRTSSARFLPCFDSAVLRVLDHLPVDCKGKKILITDYREKDHYILKRLLGIRGGDVIVQTDSKLSGDCPADIVFSAGPTPCAAVGNAYSGMAMLISVAVDSFGLPVSNSEIISDSGVFNRILPVPGGIDRVIPYIYVYNTVFCAQNH